MRDTEKTLRDEFAMAVLSGPWIRESPHEYEMRAWFGSRGGIKREEIYAAQAYAIADAMMARRDK